LRSGVEKPPPYRGATLRWEFRSGPGRLRSYISERAASVGGRTVGAVIDAKASSRSAQHSTAQHSTAQHSTALGDQEA
jgi:hypothetical protein